MAELSRADQTEQTVFRWPAADRSSMGWYGHAGNYVVRPELRAQLTALSLDLDTRRGCHQHSPLTSY
ncbi:hypothetical protein PoB_004751500 [Plakobranchus ocellatus]|uniref:Uncharacterized protein n=1 Tax=Plakobranchus ocellatus TaxID=259542 RepID=A0AAV4BKG3_9GAST|nr:hypothetical protein PoB_004751500 [Plakobranchus ocellatus]